MDEEQKTEEESKPTENTGDGVQSEAVGLIDNASAQAERLEKANAESRKILEDQKEFDAKQRLAGRASGGQPIPATPKETDEEYVEKFNKGEVNPFQE